MFTYEEYPVNGKPSLFIKKLWRLKNIDNPVDITDKSVLPNGCFNIAFINGNGLAVTHQGKQIDLSEGVYFCGQMTEALMVTIHAYSQATMVQLYPWTPVYFTETSLSAYTDQIIPIKAIKLDIIKTIDGLAKDTPEEINKRITFAFSL